MAVAAAPSGDVEVDMFVEDLSAGAEPGEPESASSAQGGGGVRVQSLIETFRSTRRSAYRSKMTPIRLLALVIAGTLSRLLTLVIARTPMWTRTMM